MVWDHLLHELPPSPFLHWCRAAEGQPLSVGHDADTWTMSVAKGLDGWRRPRRFTSVISGKTCRRDHPPQPTSQVFGWKDSDPQKAKQNQQALGSWEQ